MILDSYQPAPEWFTHNPYGIHGISHVARVLVWADRIARSVVDSGRSADIEVVRYSAVLHDVGRLNDGYDPEHGSRSAAWISSNRELFPQIDDQCLRRIVHCCVWHVPPDSAVPEMTPELMCLKDADGLERVRIRDLNPSYLRTEFARSRVQDAELLFRSTVPISRRDPWAQVRSAAIELGWWR